MVLFILISWMQQQNLQLRANIKACERGSYSGKGPSKNELSKRTYAVQEKRAQAFSDELLGYIETERAENAPLPKTRESFVDEQASHRHDPPRHYSKTKQTPAGPSKPSKPLKHSCPTRKTRSRNFTRILDIAEKMKSLTVELVNFV